MAKTEPTLLSTLFDALAEGGRAYAQNSPKFNPALALTLQDREMKRAEFSRGAQLFTKQMANTDAELRLNNQKLLDMADPEGVARRKGESEIKQLKAMNEYTMSLIPQDKIGDFDISYFDGKVKAEPKRVALSQGNKSDIQFAAAVDANPDSFPQTTVDWARDYLKNETKIRLAKERSETSQGNVALNNLYRRQENIEKSIESWEQQRIMYGRDPEKYATELSTIDEKIASSRAKLDDVLTRISGIGEPNDADPELTGMLKDPEIIKLLKELKSAKK